MMIRTHRRDLWKKIIKLESEVERLVELLEQSDANDKLTIAAFFGGGTGPFCSVPEMMAATARDQITELEAKVERLRLDTARLDWLENHPLPTEVVGGCNDGLMSKTWAIACDPMWSLREALDVVRQTTQPDPGKE